VVDFNKAVIAHGKWKDRLQDFANGTGGSLDPDVVGRDDRCEFGTWLHGDGATTKNMPSYAAVVSSHATFHRHAAEIVRRIKAGSIEEVKGMLADPNSAYARASREVILTMSRLKREVEG
jgi:methyl-accepting chemotaxis protein